MADGGRMNKTERIFKIEQLIAARKLVSFNVLQDELEVSRATLKRDLEYLRSRMKTPIVYDREANGYRLGGKRGETARVEFPGMWFNASEAAALLTMQHLLSDLQPGLLARHVEPLLERLKSLLESADHSFREIQRRVRIIHLGRKAPQPKFFEVAASALLNRRQLKIVFHSRGTNETTERAVSPQRLVCYRENWYLDAWCHLRQDIRSFAVDGIRQAELLDQSAREIADRELDEVLVHVEPHEVEEFLERSCPLGVWEAAEVVPKAEQWARVFSSFIEQEKGRAGPWPIAYKSRWSDVAETLAGGSEDERRERIRAWLAESTVRPWGARLRTLRSPFIERFLEERYAAGT